ncbi:MAG: hypothetical protein FWH21_02895 [Kiritimatiellaeota bacterium]|nr:hypothetical protein [Kiritimatiellota bacterium]
MKKAKTFLFHMVNGVLCMMLSVWLAGCKKKTTDPEESTSDGPSVTELQKQLEEALNK